MMHTYKLLIAMFGAVLASSCSEKQPPRMNAISPPSPHRRSDTIVRMRVDSAGYDSVKASVASGRDSLRNAYARNSTTLDNVGSVFTSLVHNRIFPCWYGTTWAFYGTTEVPQRDSIACGFFVTTVLRDAGVRLDRVRLACCASEQMIKSLTRPQFISRFSNVDYNEFLRTVKGYGDGLFIVGLDCHTGFILNDRDTTWFVHSCYIPPRMVLKERADTAIILQRSKYKVVGRISQDAAFVKRWLGR